MYHETIIFFSILFHYPLDGIIMMGKIDIKITLRFFEIFLDQILDGGFRSWSLQRWALISGKWAHSELWLEESEPKWALIGGERAQG